MEQESGNDFLSWFGGDRKRLEDFRRRLVYWFGKQGCRSREDCEDNTQKTLLRAIEKLARNPEIRELVPEQYIIGVAQYILKEYWKEDRKRKQSLENGDTDDKTTGPDDIVAKLGHECLAKCLQNLKPAERELVELYALSNSHYTEELTQKLGCSANALRLRIHRTIQEKLAPCVENCLNGRKN